MRIGLRILKPETVEWLRRELWRGELTRAALGRGPCEQDEGLQRIAILREALLLTETR